MAGVLFEESSAKRIKEAVRRVENSPLLTPSDARRRNNQPFVRWIIRGKLAGSLSQGGTATLNVWHWNGSTDVASGETLTVYDWLLKSGATAIASGKKVVCELDIASGRYYVTAAECP